MESASNFYEISNSFENPDYKNLDPELQKLITAYTDNSLGEHAAVFNDEKGKVLVDVTAKLKHPEEGVEGLNITTIIGDIITGSVNINDILAVRQNANVVSLKSARKITTSLRYSVRDIQAASQMLNTIEPPFQSPVNGAGVIVGIVDFGCDFNHRNFINEEGNSRILYLWDQSGDRTNLSPEPYRYGREFNQVLINQAIKNSYPYDFLKYNLQSRAHGTHVMDIAAGNGRGTNYAGVAPNADIIFVHLNANDFGSEESFGNSVQLIEAVKYIFDKADALNKPAVVNLSLGTYGGPHDGTTHAEQAFDRLINERPGRSIIIAAGNSFNDNCHHAGLLTNGTGKKINWRIPDARFRAEEHELEIWYNGNSEIDCELITPDSQRISMALDSSKDVKANGKVVARLIHRKNDPLNGDNVINIIFFEGIKTGRWSIELKNKSVDDLQYHCWIERMDPNQSTFIEGFTSDYTLGSISCGKETIVAGSYDATDPFRSLSLFSSSGPTRDNKRKPEISAPGQSIQAAGSRTQGTVSMSGTSMAAPHITGVIALLMQVGGKGLTNFDIRKILIETANKDVSANYNNRYGHGRVDALNALKTLISTTNDASVNYLLSKVLLNGKEYDTELETILNGIAKAAKTTKGKVRVNIEFE